MTLKSYDIERNLRELSDMARGTYEFWRRPNIPAVRRQLLKMHRDLEPFDYPTGRARSYLPRSRTEHPSLIGRLRRFVHRKTWETEGSVWIMLQRLFRAPSIREPKR